MNYPYFPMNTNIIPHYFGRYSDMQSMPLSLSCVEPYLISALMPMIGKRLVVETVRGSQTGTLMDVKPDHIVIGEPQGDSKFYVRIAEIVHIMPIDSESDYRTY